MKPSKYLFFPIKNGKWLRDSQGKPRVYKTSDGVILNLKNVDYDAIQVFKLDNSVSKEVFEKFRLSELETVGEGE